MFPIERAVEVLSTCTCPPPPIGDGPQEDCPRHGRLEFQAQALADAGLLRDHVPDSKVLLSALVQPHRDLYSRNAAFHHSMNTFVAMLPAMVRGLAASAVEAQHEIDQRKRQLERMPMPNLGAATWSDQVEAENQLAQDQAYFDFQQGDPPPGATV